MIRAAAWCRDRAGVALALVANGFAACASTTVIKTEPPGAKIYADGSVLGESPVFYGDEKIVGSTTHLLIKKDGCEPLQAKLSRNEEVQVGPLIGGLIFVVPLLWVMGYKPTHTFELECSK
jgi:hypothetical protein